jgi:phosphocarrier protein HPr
MKQIIITVPFKEGLHARPASELVKLCQKIKSNLELAKGELKINPKSILGIMSLGATLGDEIQITADGEDEEAAIREMENFFKE